MRSKPDVGLKKGRKEYEVALSSEMDHCSI